MTHEDWHPWVRPMTKRRAHSHARLRRWRDQYISRLWAGGGYGNRRYRHQARGLRIWLSARYPDARRPEDSERAENINTLLLCCTA